MTTGSKLLLTIAFLAAPVVSHAQATTPGATPAAKRAEAKEERKASRKEAHPELRAAREGSE
jgi:hypothetical protein